MTVVVRLLQPRTHSCLLLRSSTLNLKSSLEATSATRLIHQQACRLQQQQQQQQQPSLFIRHRFEKNNNNNYYYYNNKYNLRSFSQSSSSRSQWQSDSYANFSRSKPSIWRPTLWSFIVGGGVFIYAALETTFDTNLRMGMINQQLSQRFSNMIDKVTGYSSNRLEFEMARMRKSELKAKLGALIESAKNYGGLEVRQFTFMVAERVFSLTESQRTVLMLIGVQGLVFLAWKVPRWQRFMSIYFTHYPLSGRSYTLLTSTFSHATFMHFAFNSYAFYGFGTAAHDYLYRPVRAALDLERDETQPHVLESTARYHFVAFFIIAGIAASLTSHIFSCMFRAPRLAKAASSGSATKFARNRIVPSLGASGAIYATVVLTACAFPTQSISLIFLPTVPIPIDYGIFGLLALDVFGVIRGWRFFDHVAHLGGALFGYVYYLFFPDLFDSFRWVLEEAIEESEQEEEEKKNNSK